ncbi:hypothetical protein ACNAW0_11205 [Micromonospora sp. SL1-18]|uniref:hypothetical protein n=1 Tax=Micromonospora sp. SL1-18 TaxID=3399128 RepID=UPI003A4E1180
MISIIMFRPLSVSERRVTRQTWTLDPAHRFRAFTTETRVDASWVNTTSKLNHYGDDSDKPRWIVEDATGAVTRNIPGPDGDLVATASSAGGTRLHLTCLHADVAATIDAGLTEPELFDYEEFGGRRCRRLCLVCSG